jgi:hypothetical protein
MPNINDMTSKITYDDEYYVIWLNNDSYLTPKKDIVDRIYYQWYKSFTKK